VLEIFLDAKPLYYEKIDYTRMPRVYESVKDKFKLPKIIHVIGTNGKGTTGRFLATALHSLGYLVGHYTSPHIEKFNERIWLNGKNIDTASLEKAHEKLLTFLSEKDANALSYFEYTTLLAMLAYEGCEYIVLEAGLGGEHDATAVFESTLTLVTPIGLDHEAFLGDTIEKIAKTKLNAIKKHAILAKQLNLDVYKVAREIASQKNIVIKNYDVYLEDIDTHNIVKIAQELELSQYLQENLSLCIAALKFLKIEYKTECFKEAKLFGRLTKLSENIIVDVGHNALAAQKVYESLKEKKYVLVYNSYKDKNYKEILRILKPIILYVEIIEVDDSRIALRNDLENVMQDLDIKYKSFKKIVPEQNYLVFGSFSVLGAFLKVFNE
jgi:dihydrofolate synthase/folylpolyglutamate synthase